MTMFEPLFDVMLRQSNPRFMKRERSFNGRVGQFTKSALMNSITRTAPILALRT